MENNGYENAFQRRFNFHNIGAKIKNFTKWYCWITIVLVWIASAILFIVGITQSYNQAVWIVSALIAAVVAPFLIWISCWLMYAIGEAVDRLCRIESTVNGGASSEEKANREREAKIRSLYDQGSITEEEYRQALATEA